MRRAPARLRAALARHVDALIILVVLAAVLALAFALPAWRGLDRRIFDALTVETAPDALNQPIVLIAINEEAMAAIGKRWPWPRDLHAELLTRLARGGAAVVALDLLFADPAPEPEERAFEAAITPLKPVVMAADFTYAETGLIRMWKRVDPLPRFQEAGAFPGLATVPLDSDQFVRQMPVDADAFWRQIVKVLQVRAPTLAVPALPDDAALIRYAREDKAFDPIPYSLVLEASDADLKAAFDGRIVIVGRDVRASVELGMAQADLFSTPFLAETGMLTAGMKIHAMIVDNVLSGTWLKPLSPAGRVAISVVAAIFAFFAFRRWRPLVGLALLAGALLALTALAWYAFAHERLFIHAAAPAAVLVLGYLAYGARAYVTEARRKSEIQGAFSRYLSPELVERIAADPSKLSLGGESREITVMFTDLAGFTKLTEKNPPEVVTQVLIAHFNAMTAVIQDQRGTVVQFIGDAIMAFWNAPLDDPEHALHAVRAAIGMQEAMAKLRESLRSRGLPEVHMRIGLNTCTAVVGNMGSSTRFYYTAMGDGINLAARLEGANKFYGTGILVSAETVGRLGEAVPMRRVDRVKVSGKTQAVDVFTPVADATIAARTDVAFEAYLRRDWEAASMAYAEMLEATPGDGVASRLLERIDAWERDPALASPDGSVSLDKA